jgi:hypothetical protein
LIDETSIASAQELLDLSSFVLLRLSNANVDYNNLTALSDDQLIRDGIFSRQEIDSMNTMALAALASLRAGLKDQKLEICASCNYTNQEKKAKLQRAVMFAKDNPTGFIAGMNEVKGTAKKVGTGGIFSENPHCSFGFYVCLAAGSSVTGGIGVALTVYLCACGFCETHPPGC